MKNKFKNKKILYIAPNSIIVICDNNHNGYSREINTPLMINRPVRIRHKLDRCGYRHFYAWGSRGNIIMNIEKL